MKKFYNLRARQQHHFFMTFYDSVRLLSHPVKKYFYGLFQGGASFVDPFCYLSFTFVLFHSVLSVPVAL